VKRWAFTGLALGAALLVWPGTASAAKNINVRARVSPGPHLFGDRIDVVIDAIVDSRRVDPSSVRVEVALLPYEPFGKSSRRQISDGHVVRVTYRFPAACLSLDCVPRDNGATEKRVAFQPSRGSYIDRKGKRHTLEVAVPPLRLVARAPQQRTSRAANSSFRDPIADLRAPARTLHTSYWAAPTLLGSTFLGAAVLAFAAALVLGWPALLRMYGVLRPVVTAPAMTPLEEALVRVERASESEPGTAAHRETLARLMRELRTNRLDDLVEPARRLAWSAESPTAESSRELVDRVRHALGVTS
jgi:hypothetical protein